LKALFVATQSQNPDDLKNKLILRIFKYLLEEISNMAVFADEEDGGESESASSETN
jgi:hypothetical protein